MSRTYFGIWCPEFRMRRCRAAVGLKGRTTETARFLTLKAAERRVPDCSESELCTSCRAVCNGGIAHQIPGVTE